jgi:hypothetical protein
LFTLPSLHISRTKTKRHWAQSRLQPGLANAAYFFRNGISAVREGAA